MSMLFVGAGSGDPRTARDLRTEASDSVSALPCPES